MKPKFLKFTTWGVSLAAFLTVALFATAANDARKLTPLELIHCADDPMPVFRWICEQFVLHHDLTSAEVVRLNQEAGAYYVSGLKDAQRAEAILKRWLAQGVQINAQAETVRSQYTALHVAASDGDVRGVELLLRHGADPPIKDATGLTPLEMAKRSDARSLSATKRQVIAVLEQVQRGRR